MPEIVHIDLIFYYVYYSINHDSIDNNNNYNINNI